MWASPHRKSGLGLGAPVPDLDKLARTDNQAAAEAVEAHAVARARLAVGPAERQALAAMLRLAAASLLLGEDILSAAAAAAVPPADHQASANTAHAHLRNLAESIDAGRLVVEGDWASLGTGVLRLLRTQNQESSEIAGTAARLARQLAVLTAIASARDGDAVAEALHAAAAPVGGWRGKGDPGAMTLSITAHAGVFGALELRRGEYPCTGRLPRWRSRPDLRSRGAPIVQLLRHSASSSPSSTRLRFSPTTPPTMPDSLARALRRRLRPVWHSGLD